MATKYYKIDVNDFNYLDFYGFKRDSDKPSHIKNVIRLDDFYRTRFPHFMQRVARLQYMNFRSKENQTICDEDRNRYGVPDYFLVSEIEPNGFFEYIELLTGITFIISAECFGPVNELKTEISEEEVIQLFDNSYIEKISGLFQIAYDTEKKENVKQQLVKKLTPQKHTGNN